MSITTWKGYDRRAADAAINLNYNVLLFTVKNIRDEKGITVLECYKCLITRQRYRKSMEKPPKFGRLTQCNL